ncbi:MAG: hypothetical protein ACRDGM_19635 [bacterium]
MGTPAKYQEQYDRMKRWYARFAALDQGRRHDVESDNYVDDVYAFFMNCYHLKDWIKRDSAVAPAIQQSVEGHINANRPLKLCADICNSLKHLSLTSHRSGESPAFGKKEYGLTLGAEPSTIKLKYQVDTAAGLIDAFQLATECVDAWDTFLSGNGLK